MATYSVDAVEIFGQGVLKAEGVVVDKEGNAYGGGRNGVIYKVNPEGKVSELTTLPEGSIPNGVGYIKVALSVIAGKVGQGES